VWSIDRFRADGRMNPSIYRRGQLQLSR
jgi:hypothetical protein